MSVIVIEGSNGNKNGETFPCDDVMMEILKRLPVKPLIRFNSVSKDWFKLFRTPHFITNHHLHHSLHNSFLLLQRLPKFSSFCLIGPDLKVHDHDSQFLDFISDPVIQIVGSCNGLLCLRHTNKTLSICNPATRQIRQVPRTLADTKYFYHAGFGFSSLVNDYKLVTVSMCGSDEDEGDDAIVIPYKFKVKRVKVYSLATGSWREIDASNLQNFNPRSDSISAGGALFWKARNHDGDEFVVSFDIGCEVFTRLKVPPTLSSATAQFCSTMLSVYNNKLAMLRRFVRGNFFLASSIDLWVLDNTGTCASDGGERWIKQYSVGPFPRIIYPHNIWRNEIFCIESDLVETTVSLLSPGGNESRNLSAHTTPSSCYHTFIYAESLVQVANVQLHQ